jgi:DNA-binding response OmpR family regulator
MAERLFVLVVTNDPRLEWQVLRAVRSAGCLPMLGHVDEEGRASLRRIRPDVVLLDTAHPCAASAHFYEEAAELGARVIALGAAAQEDDARAIARRCNASWITLPAEYHLFPEALHPVELA